MLRRPISLSLTLCAILGATSYHATARDFFSWGNGVWDVSGSTGNGGAPTCVIATHWPKIGASVGFMQMWGITSLMMTNPNWNVDTEPRQDLEISMKFKDSSGAMDTY